MIRRLYVHNFRCLENFELKLAGFSSALLIGKNGAGKTTIRKALEILQKIARGSNRVSDQIGESDFTRQRKDLPMAFEIEAEIRGEVYEYSLTLEWPPNFKEVRILAEAVTVGGRSVFSRKLAEVQLSRGPRDSGFGLDWHLAALPVVQETSEEDPLFILKQYLRRMLILNPIPVDITGESQGETLQPSVHARNFGEWFTGLLAHSPRVFNRIEDYLKTVMPDLVDIKNPVIGKDWRGLVVQFKSSPATVTLPLRELSDGEKCYIIAALVIAANEAYGPLTCFWDEPDSHLALSEVGDLILALRKEHANGAQFIATSHHPEVIRRFSDENTFVLSRKNHLEPTIVRPLSELNITGDLISSLMLGEASR